MHEDSQGFFVKFVSGSTSVCRPPFATPDLTGDHPVPRTNLKFRIQSEGKQAGRISDWADLINVDLLNLCTQIIFPHLCMKHIKVLFPYSLS